MLTAEVLALIITIKNPVMGYVQLGMIGTGGSNKV
jgi:hypothetical protein